MNNAINEKSSEPKPQPVQAGVTAGQDKPSQPQQQGKFSQQHDAEKSKAAAPADKGKSAPAADNGKSESHKTDSPKKDGKAC